MKRKMIAVYILIFLISSFLVLIYGERVYARLYEQYVIFRIKQVHPEINGYTIMFAPNYEKPIDQISAEFVAFYKANRSVIQEAVCFKYDGEIKKIGEFKRETEWSENEYLFIYECRLAYTIH